MRLPKHQRGLSTAGWMFLILIIGAIITVGTKLAPLYIDHNTMSNILDGLAEEKGMVTKGSRELTEIITKRFKLNGIRSFNLKDNMTIKRPGNNLVITLDYEVRLPLVHNVDLIASFEKETIFRD